MFSKTPSPDLSAHGSYSPPSSPSSQYSRTHCKTRTAKSGISKWCSSPKLRSPRGLWGSFTPRGEPSGESDKSSLAESDSSPTYYDKSLPDFSNEEDRDAPLVYQADEKGSEKYASLMSRDSLRQALDDPIGLAKFGQFLASELGAEQLCFWLNSQQLSSDLQNLHSLCRRIHNLHVPTEAPLALNLSSKEQQELDQAAEQPQKVEDPFAKCADVILEAMHNDAWTRFVKLRLSLAQKAFVRTRRKARDSFCVVDLREGPEQIICMLSKGFIELSGYSLEEALSMNCRALQGPDSSQAAVARIRRALTIGTSIQELMINYTKAGKPFWVLLQMECLRDETGAVRYIMGHQLNLSADTSDLSWLLDDSNDIAETFESSYVKMQKEAVSSSLHLPTLQRRFTSDARNSRLREAAALAFDATAQRFSGSAGARPLGPQDGLPIPTSASAPLGLLGVSTAKVDRQLITDISQIESPPDTLQWQNYSPAKFVFLEPKSLNILFSSPSLPLDWAQGCNFARRVEELNPREVMAEIRNQIAKQEYFTIALQLRVFPPSDPYSSRGRSCPLAITPLLNRQRMVSAVVVMFPW